MENWQQIDHVVVVGLGITGLSVLRYIESLPKAIKLSVMDTRPAPPGKEEVADHIQMHLGGWQHEWLAAADLIVVTPGVPLASEPLQNALQAGKKVVGDIELFAWSVQAPVIAITGSNGKSTVTDLTGYLASAAGVKAAVGGNIGTPALDLLAQAADLYILELSSFQLETTSTLALRAAAYLNLSEDHTDRYPSYQAYGDAKQRIYRHAQVAIFNQDDRQTWPGDDAASPDQQAVVFSESNTSGADFYLSAVDQDCYLCDQQGRVIAADQLQLLGRHNLCNILAAWALLAAVKIDYRQVLPQLADYCGLAHRYEKIAEIAGVQWINDSKATNVASCMVALQAAARQGGVHLLLGGVSKEADFSPLQQLLTTLPVRLYCFGQDAQQMAACQPGAQLFDSMTQALDACNQQASAGETVLLSPGCASTDQFSDYAHRGNVFREYVRTLNAMN